MLIDSTELVNTAILPNIKTVKARFKNPWSTEFPRPYGVANCEEGCTEYWYLYTQKSPRAQRVATILAHKGYSVLLANEVLFINSECNTSLLQQKIDNLLEHQRKNREYARKLREKKIKNSSSF